jgi:hypothetical protein
VSYKQGTSNITGHGSVLFLVSAAIKTAAGFTISKAQHT